MLMRRFMSRVTKTSTCWLWTGGKRGGYGMFWYLGSNSSAHVISYMLFKGGIPKGLLVRHSCDVKNCVNPEHLLLGTTLDNWRDALERGQLNIHSKFPAETVARIRDMRTAGHTLTAISIALGVSVGQVHNIVTNKHRKNINA